MAYTDREFRKYQEATALAGTNAVNSTIEIQRIHSRSRDFVKVGTENAETNVAITLMYTVRRKSKLATFHYTTGTNVASDNTDYVKITVSKLTAGAGTTTVATYNTHGGAQGIIVKDIPAAFSVSPNSDSTLAAGDTIHYAITKHGAGKAVAIGTFTADFEEV
jgi:hypothetical protein